MTYCGSEDFDARTHSIPDDSHRAAGANPGDGGATAAVQPQRVASGALYAYLFGSSGEFIKLDLRTGTTSAQWMLPESMACPH
jgi:hypothetical protein